jgi:DNA-directed RNA polymerase subunit RPC12/RpoP
MAILLLMAGLAPLASADHDPLRIIVLVEDREYSIGSSCRVTVHAFERSDHTDVDNIPEVRVGAFTPRPILMERTGTGVYQGTFQIEQLDALNNFVLIQASATKGRTNTSSTVYDASTDTTSILAASSSGGAVKVLLYITTVSESVIRPGTKVTFRAETLLLGANIEPTDFRMGASYFTPDGSLQQENLTTTNLSTGMFEGTFTFPQVGYNVDATITASARYVNDTASRSLTVSLANFCVLYHNLGKTANQSSFEFFVADPDGGPVAGATADLSYGTDDTPSVSWKKLDLGSTDAQGRLAGTLEYDNGTRLVFLDGHFNSSGKSQSFSGVLEIAGSAGNFHPTDTGFQAVFAGSDRVLSPGKPQVLEYAFFNNSNPWDFRDVECFITAAHFSPDRPLAMSADTLVKGSVIKTDGRGRLKVSFDSPAESSTIFLRFRTATGQHPKQSEVGHYSTDGLYYSEDTDMVAAVSPFSGQELTVEASPLRFGAPLNIKATVHQGVGSSVAYASWMPGKFDPYTPPGAGSADWQMWSPVMTYLNRTESGFSGKLTIPPFMPKNLTFTMVVFAGAQNSTMPFYGAASLKPAQPVDAQVKIPWLYVIIFVIVIAAAAGGWAYAVRARRRGALSPRTPATAAAPLTLQQTITCPSCGTPFGVTRGPAPTRIRCPRCGKEGTLAALVPEPAHTPGPSIPEVKMPVTCPACGERFEVARSPAATRIRCPRCGKEGTLPPIQRPAMPAPAPDERVQGAGSRVQGDQRPTTVPAPDMQPPATAFVPSPVSRLPAAAVKTIACPRCKQRFTIEKREGPQQIRCPHCGKEGTIGGRPAAPPPPLAQAPMQALQPTPSPYPAPGTLHPAPAKPITCPQCRTRFPVQDQRRPINVRCPSCGKEGVLRK